MFIWICQGGQENAFNNRALDPYYPASIFKIIVAAALKKVFDPKSFSKESMFLIQSLG